jgi:hypothetical protein
VPTPVVTLKLPLVPFPTTAAIEVLLNIVKEVAAVPPKLTAVVPVKFVPVMITVSALLELVGVKDVMVGVLAERRIKPVLVAIPKGVVTLSVPVLPDPTTAVIVVLFTTTKEIAAVPPKLTAVAPVKLVPVIVTVAPAAAEVGVKEVMVGKDSENPIEE